MNAILIQKGFDLALQIGLELFVSYAAPWNVDTDWNHWAISERRQTENRVPVWVDVVEKCISVDNISTHKIANVEEDRSDMVTHGTRGIHVIRLRWMRTDQLHFQAD